MKMMKLVALLSPLRFLGALQLHLLLALIAMSSCRNSFSRLAVAQTPNATTDSFEARLVNSIFEKLRPPPPTKWNITQWNISGELCSGTAIDSTDILSVNPGLKCNCSYNSSTLCHVTELNIYAMDVEGDLPEELWNLTFLRYLNLHRNYFTGPIPASIGQLTQLQYLILSANALSGELPKELGMLSDLIELRLGTNNFSGSFPLELGNLARLNHLFFDSSGISGVIPSSFARLQSLRYLWGSDNQLTGQIPDFIGDWSQLILLRLQGNSFQGPIPSSFSNLASLEELIVSDLSNASFSLEFIKNMTSLHTLVLRNNNISGSIPSSIGELQNLRHVDLSFNSLSGSIPDSLFNITGLTYLYLGNNKLTGPLPQQKGSSLQTIDLSYNELSGSFPSWVNGQVNLVANNFTLSDSFTSSLPSGLNCLQRNFPCNREFPIYYNFSIGCGSQALSHRSADGLRYWYEADNQTLGPATYYTTGSRRWAVSNVAGLSFSDRQASFPPEYYFSAPSKVTNTLDSEIFQSGNASARFSTGSLRYYGLGLQNGNYIVNLQFAELQIQDGATWRSLGRRVFDIYVQGNRVEQNFDIKKAAGGRSFTSVQKTYTAIVSENYLEIHLFWAGKGTCCVPFYGSYGPLISAISATPDFIPAFRKKDQTGLIVRIVVPIGTVSLLSAFAVCFFIRRRKWRDMPEQEAFLGMDVRPYTFQYTELKEFLGMDVRPYTFEYTELKAATNDFHPTNKLGQGGFGPVFKGTLHDGRVIAVKQLSVASHQGKSQFVAEIATISVVQHRNLVKLHGCCIEGNKRLLVYEYHENKSLDKALFGTNSLHLDWPTRFDICLGVAKGLAYLHEESRLRIVHRDVKASNILLDSQLNPKISDFGLAKLYDDKMTHISTGVAGTIGYLAPEYAMWGQLTEKADVFGFGIVALEIVSGRPNSNKSLEEDKIYLLKWAWNLHENDHDMELVDPRLIEFKEDEVKRMIGVALLCTQNSPSMRPSMSRVVAMLYGDTEMPIVISRPSYPNDSRLADATRFMSCNYTESRDDTSRSMAADANYAPTNASEPMLEEMTRQGG